MESMVSEDNEESTQLRESLDEARAYLMSPNWCQNRSHAAEAPTDTSGLPRRAHRPQQRAEAQE
jgi:hypothetical protein